MSTKNTKWHKGESLVSASRIFVNLVSKLSYWAVWRLIYLITAGKGREIFLMAKMLRVTR